MKKQSIIYFFSLIIFSNIPFNVFSETENNSVSDSIRIKTILGTRHQMESDINLVYFGKAFLGTPYKSGTLDKTAPESLTINLREVDCTTFIEYCVALYITDLDNKSDFKNFALNLKKSRYRNGEIDGYASRLHYFSDWINENEKNGIIREIKCKTIPLQRQNPVSFMSTHPQLYMQLDKNPLLIEKTKQIEQQINLQNFYYIPKNRIEDVTDSIDNGDIIAITTAKPRLDISHVGIACYIDNVLHLLHASSKYGKVIIDSDPLSIQLSKNKNQTGIRIIRIVKEKGR